jgi:hypothetical protein
MKCPECVQNNQKSRVAVGGSTRTLLGFTPFYDEDGNYHNHDPNTTSTQYSCSNGHTWVEKTQHKCWCQTEETNAES